LDGFPLQNQTRKLANKAFKFNPIREKWAFVSISNHISGLCTSYAYLERG